VHGGGREVYAVVNLAGKQFTVRPEEHVKVPLLDAAVGSTIRCDEVLFYSDGADVRVGQPRLDNVAVTAEVLRHARDKKVVVFKMKRRKNYRRTRGHRQDYTLLKIKEISA
jgi:large subunit ribosomal protein L21